MSEELKQKIKDIAQSHARHAVFEQKKGIVLGNIEVIHWEHNVAELIEDGINEFIQSQSIPDASHPEDSCQECGRPNIVWFTSNEFWNNVVGEEKQLILCPSCFGKRADKKYPNLVYYVGLEQPRQHSTNCSGTMEQGTYLAELCKECGGTIDIIESIPDEQTAEEIIKKWSSLYSTSKESCDDLKKIILSTLQHKEESE